MEESKEQRKAARAAHIKAHRAWLASPETHAATRKALEDNAKLCMGEPSGAQFPPSRETQILFAKWFRRNFFSVVDEFNADQAALDDAEWEKLAQEKVRMQGLQPKLKAWHFTENPIKLYHRKN